jgi:hypothetical protein
LVTGVLQLPQGAHLTFDETTLQTGSLTPKGVENTVLLKNLMESQMVLVTYDIEPNFLFYSPTATGSLRLNYEQCISLNLFSGRI